MKKFIAAVVGFLCVSAIGAQSISVNPAQPQVGVIVHFVFHSGSAGPSTITWTFGDGQTLSAGGEQVDHTFRDPGSYEVKADCAGTITRVTITVTDNRRVEVSGSRFLAGAPVAFKAKQFVSSSIRWEYGDGQTEMGGTSVNHVYVNPGAYTVKAFDSAGQAPTAIVCQVNVDSDSRKLSAEPNNPRACQVINMSAQSFPSANLHWDFGDDKTDNGGAQMSHMYDRPGTFRVRVWEISQDPATSLTLNLHVAADERQLQAQPASPHAAQSVVLTATQFQSASLRWDYGDGRIENGGAIMSHAYANPGSYKIQVTSGQPAECAVVLNLSVQPDNRRVDVLNSGSLYEDMDVELQARDFSTSQLRWDFGDGQIVTGGERTKHRYGQPGSYVVRVGDADNQLQLVVEKRLQITNDPRSITVRSQLVFAGASVELEAANFRGPSVAWDLGDGTQRSGALRLTHIWPRPGSYRVRAVDNGGQDGKAFEKTVQVELDPREIVVPSEIIAGEAVDIVLRNASGGSFVWKFSDGQNASGVQAADRAFRSPGMLRVVVEDTSGRYPDLQKEFVVSADNRVLRSSAAFALPGEKVTFHAERFRGSRIRWNFGDGTVREGAVDETYVFAKPGKFRVTASEANSTSRKSFTTDMTVAEQMPGFAIQTLELSFADGAYFKLAGHNSMPPAYAMRLKTSGRAVLRGQIMLDGVSLSLFQMVVSSGVTSLPENQKPRLPLIGLGLHRLTVKFDNFPWDQKIPILRYFVGDNEAIRIIGPLPGSRVSSLQPLMLKWRRSARQGQVQVAMSEIPLQFLNDSQIVWLDAGSGNEMKLNPAGYKPGAWIYWQVREMSADRVLSTSDYASFRLTDR